MLISFSFDYVAIATMNGQISGCRFRQFNLRFSQDFLSINEK